MLSEVLHQNGIALQADTQCFLFNKIIWLHFIESSQDLYEVGKRDSIISILQMRKLNLRKIKVILQGLTWLIQLFPDKKRVFYLMTGASLVAQRVKGLPAIQETWVWSLAWKDPLEKGIDIHSSILEWRIPWTEEPGRLQSRELESQMQLSNYHYLMINNNYLKNYKVSDFKRFYQSSL